MRINKATIRNNIAGRDINRETKGGNRSDMADAVTLDCVYESLREIIFTKDLEGRITSCNTLFAKRYGLDKSDLIGKTAFEIPVFSQGAAEAFAEADRKVIESKMPSVTRNWIAYADGSKTFSELTKTPLIKNGEVTGVLTTINDITEMKLVLDEAEHHNRILETIGKVSTLLLEPDINAFDQAISEAMSIIAYGINADRIDIWRLRSDGGKTFYTLEYDWVSDKAITNGTDVSVKKDSIAIDSKVIPFMESILIKGKSINSKVCNMPIAAQKLFQESGIESALSALIMPLMLGDEYGGFIGAFDVYDERIFTENEELLLRSSRQMIASTMMRMEITKDLMHRTQQLQHEATTRRDFLARMSHEIRTPLNAIIGMSELALRERMSNAASEHITTVKHTGLNLLSIINDVLDLSKIESGKTEVINAQYSLSSVIYDIISIIRMRIAYSRIRFIVDIDSGLPSGLVGDEGKIRQILINLLSNAVKYTQKGFVKLTVKGKMHDGDTLDLIFIVADSGKGIKDEDQGKLFRDYIQVDSEKNVGIEGVGLGLSITHGFLKAMNGNVTLKSTYGEGSEFTINIPQMIGDSTRLAEVIEPEKKKTLVYERRSLYVDTLVNALDNLGVSFDIVDNPDDVLMRMETGSHAYLIGSKDLLIDIKDEMDKLDTEIQIVGIAEFGDESDSIWRTLSTPIHTISLANMYNGKIDSYMYEYEEENSLMFSAPEAKVLIVDDIATNLKVAAGLLAIYDVHIDACDGGVEAIELVRENEYDVIFMDHRMPGMDGVEATEAIRAMGKDNEYFANVPIIALTANVMSNAQDMFREAGFNDFLAKPIDIAVLGGIMRKWIPKSKQRRYYAIESAPDKSVETGVTLRIDGVDVERGLRASGGRLDTYLEILVTFVDEASERLTEIHEYLSAGNLRMYTISVHALKGALANIGARELYETAEKLEAADEFKDNSQLEKNNKRFISGVNRLLSNIKNVLEENTKSSGRSIDSSREETEEFIETLRELKSALADMDAGTMNKALETLLSDALTEQGLSTVRLISKHVLMAEYDDAEQIAEKLISSLEAGQDGPEGMA